MIDLGRPFANYNAKPLVQYTSGQLACNIRRELKNAFESKNVFPLGNEFEIYYPKFRVTKKDFKSKSSRKIFVEILKTPFEIFTDEFIDLFKSVGWKGIAEEELKCGIHIERYKPEAYDLLQMTKRIAESFDHGFCHRAIRVEKIHNYYVSIEFAQKEPI